MKKSVIIVVVSVATSIFGIEPSELVRLYQDSFTNDAASRELDELLRENRNLLSELQSRMNGTELLLLYGVIDSVTPTSENLMITFRFAGFAVKHNGVMRDTGEYVANNEALILTPDKEAWLFDGGHANVSLVPATFKNKKKGFRVTSTFNAKSFGGDLKSNTGYVALSNTPIDVGEDNVEMIMKDGEWKTAKEYYAIIEREDRLQELRLEYAHQRREAEKLLQGEELTNRLAVMEHEARLEMKRIESGEPSEGRATASPPSRLWIYAVIALCTLSAVLWLARKKRT